MLFWHAYNDCSFDLFADGGVIVVPITLGTRLEEDTGGRAIVDERENRHGAPDELTHRGR